MSKGRQSKKENREDIFCREYVVDLNGARAAIAAGYARKGAKVRASELLTNRNVRARIAELQKAKADKLDLSAEKVLSGLSPLAFSNILDYVKIDKNGDPRPDLSNLTRDQAAAIQEITVDEYMDGRGKGARKVRRIKIKLVDKVRALELLGKHLKLFTDRVEVTGLDGLADAIAQARKRVK